MSKNRFSARLRALLATVSILSAGALAAQTVPDQGVPQTGLNLPDNLQIFGKADPNIRKPTAIVNEAVITGTDVDQRLALISALRGLRVPPEQMDQFRLQVLRQLIDETLQVQEAANNEITITPQELTQSYARIAQNMRMTPDQLTAMLDQAGSSAESMRRQIQGELAWTRLLQRRVEPMVNVSDAEVQSVIQRLEAAKGTEEYELSEIYVSANASTAPQVQQRMAGMIQAMRDGQSFQGLAATNSEATTAGNGGALGWVRAAMLPEPLARAAQGMEVGQVAGPIEVPGGYSVLYLTDKRQVLMADPRDAVLALRQLTLNFPAGTTQAQASQTVARFATAVQGINGCGGVQAVAQQIGADVVDNDAVRIRDLPPQLQEIMIGLQVGQATPPFGSVDSGVRTLVLCGRDDPASTAAPSAERIQRGLEQDRVNLRAQRMLRDLRRDAVVEYR